MGKKLIYMTLDCETATLPFANEVANNDPEKKKKIAIAKPLIYDIGWALMYRDGTIFSRKQFLVTETFSVPSVFNTAYYASKRPLYLAMMERGEIDCLPWKAIAAELEKDLAIADFVGAFNSMFDFKKAIPFTELYINKLYSPAYYEWESMQRKICERIAAGIQKKNEREFDPEHFDFRGKQYKLYDVWGMACENILNRRSYKEMCLENGMLTASGEYFKTSAEAAFRYIANETGFEEAHTALADAEIESAILAKMLRRKAVKVGIDYFPFQKLGHPIDFVKNEARKTQKANYAKCVRDTMRAYLGEEFDEAEMGDYKRRIYAKIKELEEILEGE